MDTSNGSPEPGKAPDPDTTQKVQQINNLLSSEETRSRGMQIMSPYISVLSRESFTQNCLKWMQNCCNVDDCSDVVLSLKNLQLLIEESSKYNSLNNSVSQFLRTRFFGKFFKLFIHIDEGWKCVEVCLNHYKGSVNTHQDKIKESALSAIEKRIIPPEIARVYALLPGIGTEGSDGINYANKWKSQFEEILRISNSVLHDLYRDVMEVQVYDTESYSKQANLDYIDEEMLYRLFYNFCGVLQFMLLCPFPTAKTIAPSRVFEVICRCLSVTSKTLGNIEVTQRYRLASWLPQFHIVANSLLRALVVACKTHLLPYTGLITKLLKQTIQSTDGCTDCDASVRLRLRISVYKTWRKWILSSIGGASYESVSHALALAALDDIKSARVTQNGGDTNNSMETSEDVHNPKISSSIRRLLCISALQALVVYTREIGFFLKLEQLKTIQMSVIKQILDVQNSPVPPYSTSPRCRYELYSLLMELINCQCPNWPSPINWGLELFSKGIYDLDSGVSNLCSSSMENLTNIIHPEFVSAPSAAVRDAMEQ